MTSPGCMKRYAEAVESVLERHPDGFVMDGLLSATGLSKAQVEKGLQAAKVRGNMVMQFRDRVGQTRWFHMKHAQHAQEVLAARKAASKNAYNAYHRRKQMTYRQADKLIAEATCDEVVQRVVCAKKALPLKTRPPASVWEYARIAAA